MNESMSSRGWGNIKCGDREGSEVFWFDRLGMMVRCRELMVIVKRCSLSLLAAREEGGNKKGRWEKRRSGSCETWKEKGIGMESFLVRTPFLLHSAL